MFGAGPFWADDEKTWEGEGMVIIRAGSLAEAEKIAAEDPMHKSGARSFRVRPWLLNEGVVTLKVRYSDGSRELVCGCRIGGDRGPDGARRRQPADPIRRHYPGQGPDDDVHAEVRFDQDRRGSP